VYESGGDDETPDCLIPLKYTKFEDVELFSKSSENAELDESCMPDDFASACPLMKDLWTLSASSQYEDGKVRFSKQSVYLSKSPALVRCVFKNDTGRHEAWVSRETGKLLLVDGAIVSEDIEALQKEKASKKASLPADVLLAAEQGIQCYDEGKTEEAMVPLKKAADGGHAKARYYYAKCLLKVGKTDEAIKLVKEGADAGGPLSMMLLGDLYAQEKIKTTDPKQKDVLANQWYEKAVEKGSAEAKGALGENLRTGTGIEKDVNRAFVMLYEACEKLKGSAKAKAMRRIAHMYRDGVVGVADRPKANQLYCRAANIGDGWSLYELGRTYFEGLGVDKNLGEARRLLELAQNKKNKEAAKLLAKIPKTTALSTDCPSGVTGVPGKGELPEFVRKDYEIAKNGKLWRSKDGKVVKGGKSQEKSMTPSAKKRWKFVLIGLLFGVFGLHFLYARRKGWFFFYWLMIIANIAQTKVPAMADAVGKTPYFGLVAGLMLVGSSFFMKKDCDGNRM